MAADSHADPRTTRPSWWWDDFNDEAMWNGVFQGGGAKGIAYCGPLADFAERGCWFTSVAGSSAGAITASLIAAGVHPDEFLGLTAQLLASVKRRLRLPVFDSADLRTALDEIYRTQVDLKSRAKPNAPLEPQRSDDGVTFRALYETTGIGLYILALDSTAGSPLPFCVETTPDFAVADAVVASSGIPFAFANQFLVVREWGSNSPFLHRLVDGGAWANFPIFVYDDLAFREYFDLTAPIAPRTLGFVLADPLGALQGAPWRFATAEDRATAFIRPVGWPAIGLAALAVLVAGAGVLGSAAIIEAGEGVAAIVTATLFALFSAILVAVMVGATLVSAGLHGQLGDVSRSLLGLATRPAIWHGLGSDPSSRVVFVSYGNLTTTGFRLLPEVVKAVARKSREDCAGQLDDVLAGKNYIRTFRHTYRDVNSGDHALRSDTDDAGLRD